MSFFEKLNPFKKKEELLVVGGSGVELVEKPKRPPSIYFLVISVFFLLGCFVLTVLSTWDLIENQEFQLQNFYQTREQKKIEQKNLEALTTLSTRAETIRDDLKLVHEAVPVDPRYDQVISYLEHLFKDIRSRTFIGVPESISWDLVLENDISNPDLQALGIYEYSFPFLGSSEAFLEVLEALRSNRRLIDVRSLRSIKLTEDGNVSADVIFWTYHLLSS